jgi:hypothetical protein
MAVPSNEKHKEYARYASYCLTGMAGDDPDTREIYHEMALEWIKLADAALRPLKLIARHPE